MNRSLCGLTTVALAMFTGTVAADTLPGEMAPDVIDGTLVAADCLGARDQRPRCNQRALDAGLPGGIFTQQRFIVLLVDGRILARTCAANVAGHLRVAGILHRHAHAMSVFRLEENCGKGWSVVNLPHAGTLASGAAGGDE